MDYYKNVDELDWQVGNVIGFSSKKLLSLTGSNFKLVKVAPFATYPVHVHPNKTEVLLILEGTISATIDDNIYKGKPSDIFMFPVGIQHSIINTSNKECIVFIASMNN